MRILLFTLLLLVPAQGLAQGRNAYKGFFEEGVAHYDAGTFDAALKAFTEAYSLQKKATIYRGEGTFTGLYLPRYRMALCYEQLGQLLAAEEWVKESQTALEGDVIKRKKKELAAYNTDTARILKKAGDFRQVKTQEYNRKLEEAKALVNAKKFDAAKKAFEALASTDSSRSEAAAELRALPATKQNYLKGRELDVRSAIMQKDFSRAQGLLDSIAAIDNGYSNLPLLRSELKGAEEAERAAKVAAATPPPTREEPKQPVVETKTKPPKTTETTKNPERDSERVAAQARATAGRNRAALRTALLATIEPYRRGDAATALAQLQEIDTELGMKSSSYHWLKGVYLLSVQHQQEHPESDLEERAREALKTVTQLLPSFEPNRSLYPDFVLNFYAQVKAGR